MKNYILFTLLIALIVGCESEYTKYSGENVVFIHNYGDTTKLSFTYVDSEVKELTKNLLIKCIGDVCDYDLEVRMETTLYHCIAGTDFEPIEEKYIIKAGETSVTIPIVLKRTVQLQKEVKMITLHLKESKDFKLFFEYGSPDGKTTQSSRIEHVIEFSELLTKEPETWSESKFGKFSPAKFILICDVAKISRVNFVDRTYMSPGRVSITAQVVQNYLNERKASGDPVFEEDGTEMGIGLNVN